MFVCGIYWFVNACICTSKCERYASNKISFWLCLSIRTHCFFPMNWNLLVRKGKFCKLHVGNSLCNGLCTLSIHYIQMEQNYGKNAYWIRFFVCTNGYIFKFSQLLLLCEEILLPSMYAVKVMFSSCLCVCVCVCMFRL